MKRLFAKVVIVALICSAGSAFGTPKKEKKEPAAEIPSASKNTAAHSLSGKVVETMNAGGYTYVCLEKNGSKTWVAVPEIKVVLGQQMSFQPGTEMQNFESKSLNRTFPSIIFSGGPLSGDDTQKTLPAGHPGSSGAVTQPAEKIHVEKATGSDAYTVADIFAQRAKLHKKQAVVRAKVVKVSAGIMGKNWIHLQDGTGDAAKGTNKLVATSQDLPQVGEIITIKGTLYKDKDFGAGYKYNVIMEDASVKR